MTPVSPPWSEGARRRGSIETTKRSKFGISLFPDARSLDQVFTLAGAADEAGLDLLGVQDHPYNAKFVDTMALIGTLLERTGSISVFPDVASLPLRPPAMLAKTAATLDLLSAGRFELGLGAGSSLPAAAAYGGPARSGREAVDALLEAIAVIRALWSGGRGIRIAGDHYGLGGAQGGPPPAHQVQIWIGSFGPRMLRLTGSHSDGWAAPLSSYLPFEDQLEAQDRIDAGAESVGRDPTEVRRIAQLPGLITRDRDDGAPRETRPIVGPPGRWVEAILDLHRHKRFDDFIFWPLEPDEAQVRAFAEQVVPEVRRSLAGATPGGAMEGARKLVAGGAEVPSIMAAREVDPSVVAQYERLGVDPTPDVGKRSTEPTWDESKRPHRAASGPEVRYDARAKAAGQHLIDIHDHLRGELAELRDVVEQVRDGALGAGQARSALNAMTLRENDWTLGAFCSRYCRAVTLHHSLEDGSVFPDLRRAESDLDPVLDRLTEEHHVIHDAIEAVDRALVDHLEHPGDFDGLQNAIDVLTDSLLSHLSYEEYELVEPLARMWSSDA